MPYTNRAARCQVQALVRPSGGEPDAEQWSYEAPPPLEPLLPHDELGNIAEVARTVSVWPHQHLDGVSRSLLAFGGEVGSGVAQVNLPDLELDPACGEGPKGTLQLRDASSGWWTL